MIGNKHTVFVIGAGWVGAPLARKLTIEGHTVRATTRASEKVKPFELAGLTPILWNSEHHAPGIERSLKLREAAADASLWILTVPPNRQMNQSENESWHRDVLSAAEASGVVRLVVLSSTSVYPMGGMMQENDASIKAISPHSGKSMLALEQVFDSAKCDVVILRLGALIGLSRHPAIRASKIGWSDPLRRMNATSLEDAVNACAHVLLKDRCCGAFNVVTPHHPTFNALGKRLVELGWPERLYDQHQEEQIQDVNSKEVSSIKLIESGFEFRTKSLFDWAEKMGGPQSQMSIPFGHHVIQGTLHGSDEILGEAENQAKEVVVFAHGYKGFKDWGAWGVVMDALSDSDRMAFRFDFTHNGVHPLFPEEIIETEKWSFNTYRNEIEELKAVVVYWQNRGHRVNLIGHSRGGGISSIAAAELQAVGFPIKSCALWASVSDFEARFPEQPKLEEWRKTDCLKVVNARTGQTLHHRFSFYESFQKEAQNLSIEGAVRKLHCPLFIAHAIDDVSVAAHEAESIARASGTDVLWIQIGGHTFGTHHPWSMSTLPEPMVELIEATKEFFKS